MNRRHDIDALRVLAFGLLILYHLGMLYVGPADDWAFHLKSSYLAHWLPYPMLASGFWRMDLLFLISAASSTDAPGAERLVMDAGETWMLRSRYPGCSPSVRHGGYRSAIRSSASAAHRGVPAEPHR